MYTNKFDQTNNSKVITTHYFTTNLQTLKNSEYLAQEL